MTALGVALVTAAVQWRGVAADRRGLGFALSAGLLDGLGLTCYVLAATAGMIGVASAILSLYAGVTVLLGVVVMRERVGPPQLAGLLFSAISVLLLAH